MTGATKWNSSIVHFIIYTCAFPTVTCQNVSHYEMENLLKALFSPNMPDTVESNSIKIHLNQTELCNKGHIIYLCVIPFSSVQPVFQLMYNQIPSLYLHYIVMLLALGLLICKK